MIWGLSVTRLSAPGCLATITYYWGPLEQDGCCRFNVFSPSGCSHHAFQLFWLWPPLMVIVICDCIVLIVDRLFYFCVSFLCICFHIHTLDIFSLILDPWNRTMHVCTRFSRCRDTAWRRIRWGKQKKKKKSLKETLCVRERQIHTSFLPVFFNGFSFPDHSRRFRNTSTIDFFVVCVAKSQQGYLIIFIVCQILQLSNFSLFFVFLPLSLFFLNKFLSLFHTPFSF